MLRSTASVWPESHPSLLTIIKSSKKPENVWFQIYYGAAGFVTWIALRLGWTPNQLTVTGALLNFAALAYFMAASRNVYAIVLTYVLLNIAHVFDCADGQLAFVANMRSERGYWLDSSLDVFKSAFLTLLLIKVIVAYGGGYSFQNWLEQVAFCAAVGNLINYAVSVHALRYRETIDGYQKKSFDRVLSSQGLKRYLSEAIISHLREYGNFLLVFVLFAVDRRIALWCVVLLGLSHWVFALRRVVVINRQLNSL